MQRWVPRRVGLVNYWYYDEEEFEFANGKLLLRGSNGSGKSVTMQSLIPLLLDGNKSPERLDPFGSRARQMQDYLLDEGRSIDQRTGYLFMEFKRGAAQQFLTIGLGLLARRHRPVDSWGFAITDGRRIGRDLELYKSAFLADGGGAKVPISKKELRELLGDGGVFCSSQGDYMALVNQLLFGFHSLDEYDELIKLLIQLRSPKLSKDFRPNVLYGIMNSSLQALSDEDLRPLTETVENMDQMRTQLAELKRNQRAAAKIQSEYNKYNRALLYNKAVNWQEARAGLRRRERAIRENERLQQAEQEEFQALGIKISRLDQEQTALAAKELELRDDDAFRLEERYQAQLRRRDELGQQLQLKEANLTQKIAREKDLEKQTSQVLWQSEHLEKSLQADLSELDEIGEGVLFADHIFDRDDLRQAWTEPFDFAPWHRDAQHYQHRLKQVRSALEEKERAIKRYDELLAEQDRFTNERELAEREQENQLEKLERERQSYLAVLATWYAQLEELRLQTDERHSLHQLVLDYGEGKGRADLEKFLFPLWRKFDNELAEKILQEKQIHGLLSKDRADTVQALAEWQAQEEPEPERDPQISATRRLLRQAKVDHLPFYQAVDFKEGVPAAMRATMETVFLDLGILDALIVPEDQQSKARQVLGKGSDKILLAAAAARCDGQAGLNAVLEAVCSPEPLRNQVERFLAGFALSEIESEWSIKKDGCFSFGKLVGRARTGIPARFIGVETRRLFRAEKIEALRQELAHLEKQLDSLRRNLGRLEASRVQLQQELGSLPPTNSLEQQVEALLAAERKTLLIGERLEAHGLLLQNQYALVQKQSNLVREKTLGLSLPPALTKVQAAEEGMQAYAVALARLQGGYDRWLAVRDQGASLLSGLEVLREDVDLLKGELNLLKRELDGCLRLVRELQSLRERPEFKRLQAEIVNIVSRLKEIPQEILGKATRRGRLEGSLSGLARELEKERLELETEQRLLKQAEKELRSEANLGFAKRLQGETPEELVSEVMELLGKEESVKDLDENLLTRRLQEAVYAERPDLLDYGLIIGELDSRLVVTARLENQTVSLYQLVDWLDGEIARNELLLDEADRELFEEIILQTVGQKIRAKIYRAEEWVRNMNRLMETRDTTSGLTLQLQWKPKPAETEDELGTWDLVRILKTDVTILSEEVFNRVTNHFRSKVERAKARLAEHDSPLSFHQTIREILDYRRWFEFCLFFRKTGEPRRELTNRAFDQLSGGEKAMAMYIPLFSSVYSRYQGARDDAPRLISLDEAFAGVDDSNIRDMFELMEHLGFDYIINSQILWGDYDTVPELAICELVRPKNAEHVSVIRYLWDGKVRTLLTAVGEE